MFFGKKARPAERRSEKNVKNPRKIKELLQMQFSYMHLKQPEFRSIRDFIR